ncbi:FeoB-associated Cys-rich membrane protein [Fusobacterium sp. IOR10]|uniref:FeoB-associated Cys-rich membrane protein n=1 Tax=Fusobacterium sp. IOR10 TaxID=2665157 RepID=UPI0013D52CFB|nr:FeoB-associated Cys-rich membrane protein [Fusobacterium sp. IOR10]
MNLATGILGLIIFVIFVFIVRKMIIDKKNHKCSCGCSTCGISGACSSNKKTEKKKKEL